MGRGSFGLMIEARDSAETSVYVYHTTWRDIPGDCSFHIQYLFECGNFLLCGIKANIDGFDES
jgi:hypothetical protein